MKWYIKNVHHQILTPLNAITLENAIGIQWKQFHTLWQNELSCWGWVGTILAITSQDLGNLIHDMFPHKLWIMIQSLPDSWKSKHTSACKDWAWQLLCWQIVICHKMSKVVVIYTNNYREFLHVQFFVCLGYISWSQVSITGCSHSSHLQNPFYQLVLTKYIKYIKLKDNGL